MKKFKPMLVLFLSIILIGCNSGTKEVATYFEEDLKEPKAKLQEINEGMETFKNEIVSLKPQDALLTLKEKVISKAEKISEELSAKEIKNEELNEFNQSTIDVIDAEVKRYEEIIINFEGVLEKENPDEILTMDLQTAAQSVHKYNEELYEAVNTLNEKLNVLTEEYDDIDWKEGELFTQQEGDIDELNATTDEIIRYFANGVIVEMEENGDNSPTEEQETELDQDDGEETTENDHTQADQGDTEVTFNGNIEINDVFSITGETNLLPGSILDVTVFQFGSENPYFNQEMTVENNGTFDLNIELKEEDLIGLPIEVRVGYYPEKADDDAKEVYGEEGEHLTGPFALKYTNIKRTRVGAFAYGYIELKEGAKEDLTAPKWDKADDYGELDVWMEAGKS